MMNRWSSWTARLRWTTLAAWIAITVVSALALPSLSDVVRHTEQTFIPKQAESAQALKLLQEINPDAKSRTSAVIVLSRGGGLNAGDRAWMNRTLAAVEARKDELGITGLLDANTQPELAGRFLSTDKTTMLAIVYLPRSDFDDATRETLARLKRLLAGAPEGAEVELTGSAAISQDFQESSREGLKRTESVTIGLVLVILLIVFRSPVAPIVPLLTIGVSLVISRGITAWAASFGLPVTSFTESFLIAVLFGAGTDYCILMIGRYREELGVDGEPVAAMRRTLRGVGPTILYATSTVFAAFFLIGFAQFGLYKSGAGVAIGLLVTLLAGMTLAPALILLLGKALFWPLWPGKGNASPHGHSKLWASAAAIASKRSVLVMLSAILLLTPITFLFQGKRSFDDISEISPSLGSVVGFHQTERAFGAGEVFPLTMVVTSSESLRTPSAFAALEQASSDLAHVKGVREVRSATRPLGEKLKVGQAGGAPQGQTSAEENKAGSARQQALLRGLEAIALRAVPISQGLVGILPSIRPIIDALMPFFTEQLQASEGIADLKDLLEQGNGSTQAPSVETDPIKAGMQQILRFYMSPDGRTTKIDIIMKTNPFSTETMDSVDTLTAALRKSLDESVITDPQVFASGASAKYNELREISYRDFLRTGALVLVGIAIVLMLLLRSIIGPLYVLAALVFNYLITMGLLEFLYVKMLGFDGLSWTASFFIFMVIVALGVDYSIFLMARYREEYRYGNSKEAMTKAMTSTGGIIISAAAIMAGTFGALGFSGVDTLIQIGVGTMIGLLLYATLFMSLVVPAITFLVGERNRWPFRKR
ncbi:MMPL family transporter [Cohnella yongneupensis]|uniref:MMPL family transporter n=1 Tax=Cohnella yongneupensis TaxID=425006 RepID=A0ABW0QVS7_9BACL